MAALVLALVQTSTASAHPPASAHSHRAAWAVIRYYDHHGRLVYKHRYGPGTEGHAIAVPRHLLRDHGTGGSSSASGSAHVTISQEDRPLGLNTLWKFKIDTTWTWDRADETVDPTEYGFTWGDDLDSSWSWDGVQSRKNDYIVYDTTPHLGLTSGFHHMVWGEYDGPAMGSIDRHEYPKNVLEVHDDGTWYWSTSCCGAP